MKSLLPRSGHSACVYEDWMLIFGGIHEITKELEDMAVYNFKTQEWIHFFKTAQDKAMKKQIEESQSPGVTYSKGNKSPTRT